MHTATVSAKGWVVIPKSIREKHGLKKGSRVQILDYGQILVIVPLPDDPVEALHGMFGGGTFVDRGTPGRARTGASRGGTDW